MARSFDVNVALSVAISSALCVVITTIFALIA